MNMFDHWSWMPYMWPKEIKPITEGKSYGKGHPRDNSKQKKIAFNHKVAKRRAKNKASRKARKGSR